MLTKHGMVARKSRGTSVYYRIADDQIYALCDLVCGNIARQFERTVRDRKAFVRTAAQAGRPK
jgi:DNA-binding transcriptional ArsR family regulator